MLHKSCFLKLKGGGVSLFLLVGEIPFFFFKLKAMLNYDWHDANTVKYKSISHRHGRINSSVMEGHWFFFLSLAIC